LKLNIEPEHHLAQQTDMEAYLRSDLTGIVVDHDRYMDEKFANRMRFSFAHELDHFFLHRELYERAAFESAEEWKEILLGLPEADYTYFEYQANEFAGRLLVPREVLIHEIENASDVLKRNKMLDHIKSDPYAVLSAISTRIGKTFGVSFEVIERRAEREKLWPPDI
jgi:Zn-dependent peptidase ImmA (M78 family)